MVWLAAEGSARINQTERSTWYPLGSWCAGAWCGGGSLMPSGLGTWCQRGLVVSSGVGLGGGRGVLSVIPHGSKSVAPAAVRIMQSDWTKNSVCLLSPLSQTAGVPTQGRSCISNAKKIPVGTATMASCGGSAATAWNVQEGWPGRWAPVHMPPVVYASSEGVQCPRSSPPWK